MVQVSGKWHPKVCNCGYCAVLRAEAGVQSVLGKKEGMTTTRDMISRAVFAPGGEYSEQLKDGRIVKVLLSKVNNIPGIRNHTKSYWYVDKKRVTRATAALILRNRT